MLNAPEWWSDDYCWLGALLDTDNGPQNGAALRALAFHLMEDSGPCCPGEDCGGRKEWALMRKEQEGK